MKTAGNLIDALAGIELDDPENWIIAITYSPNTGEVFVSVMGPCGCTTCSGYECKDCIITDEWIGRAVDATTKHFRGFQEKSAEMHAQRPMMDLSFDCFRDD